jgi:hypothetical protein
MIVFDENIESYWINLIKGRGIEYISVREHYQGISDNAIIDFVNPYGMFPSTSSGN